MNNQLSALVKPADSAVSADGGAAPRVTRDWRSRWAAALPWLMLLAFVGLLAIVLGNRILPAKELTIATVVTVRQSADAVVTIAESATETEAVEPAVAEAAAFDAPMLFQASGWVEPDPYSTKATALIDGVVKTVEVLEGDLVKKGELLATLIDDDARLDLETATSQLASLKAQSAGHHQQIAIVEAERKSLARQVAVAEARRNQSQDLVDRLQKVSKGGVAERDMAKARLELATQEAEVAALAITEAELKARITQLIEIQSDFRARIKQAATDIERKQLTLDRTRIESPIEGRVLRLLASPGQKRMLGSDNMDSATVAILYDPKHLQARIDVPLAEAAQLEVGQPVRLRSELLPGKTFRGRVTRIVGEADLQRNTLQAKVAIQSPDERLRPEMLCRAEFLPLQQSAGTGSGETLAPSNSAPRFSAGSNRVQIFVPTAAFPSALDERTNETTVWKVDVSGDHITPQEITLGRETREDHRQVVSGLKPGDRVVLNPPADLESGDRFRSIDSRESDSTSTSPES